jgi:hypothetical protein
MVSLITCNRVTVNDSIGKYFHDGQNVSRINEIHAPRVRHDKVVQDRPCTDDMGLG